MCLAFGLVVIIAKLCFQGGIYNVVVFCFRPVCEHSEIVFPMGILLCFLAFELFAGIANSRVQEGIYNVFGFRPGFEHSEIAFSMGVL